MPNPEKPFLPRTSNRPILSDVVTPQRAVAANQIFRPPPSRLKTRSSFFKNHWKIIFIILVIFFAYVFVSLAGSRMVVSVTPRRTSIVVDKTTSLSVDPKETAKLLIRTIAIPGSRQGSFSGKSTISSVEKKAHGMVTIFNKASASPQVLVVTTRLKTSDGKLYRLPQTVTVPGYHMQNKEIVPGSLNVEIVADQAGEAYNIGLSDFSFPGFAGSPKFTLVFARSQTPMEGGFQGQARTINADDVTKALINLSAEGQAAASGILQSKLPPNTLLLKGSVDYVVTNQTVTPSPNDPNTFTLAVQEEARGAIIDTNTLTRFLGTNSVPNPTITNASDLAYELSGYQYAKPQGQLHIKGNANIESAVDPEAIKTYIVAESKKQSREILQAFPVLSSVEVRFSPFWWSSIPLSTGRIDIKISMR